MLKCVVSERGCWEQPGWALGSPRDAERRDAMHLRLVGSQEGPTHLVAHQLGGSCPQPCWQHRNGPNWARWGQEHPCWALAAARAPQTPPVLIGAALTAA